MAKRGTFQEYRSQPTELELLGLWVENKFPDITSAVIVILASEDRGEKDERGRWECSRDVNYILKILGMKKVPFDMEDRIESTDFLIVPCGSSGEARSLFHRLATGDFKIEAHRVLSGEIVESRRVIG